MVIIIFYHFWFSNPVPPWILSGIGACSLNKPQLEHVSLISEFNYPWNDIFSRGGGFPCVCFSLPLQVWGKAGQKSVIRSKHICLRNTGYSWIKDAKSFFYFLKYLSLKYFPAASGSCAAEGLWSAAAFIWIGGRSSLKSAQNEKVEGVATPWKNHICQNWVLASQGLFSLTLPNSSSSVKSQSPAAWGDWMCTSGTVTNPE